MQVCGKETNQNLNSDGILSNFYFLLYFSIFQILNYYTLTVQEMLLNEMFT